MKPERRLQHLHERIAELEAGGPRNEPRRAPVWSALIVLALGFAGGRAAALRAEPPAVAVPAYGPARYAKPEPGALRVAVPADGFEVDGPVLLDVNGDGARDIVLRCWHRGLRSAKLFVVALDHHTLDPIWTTDGFPGNHDHPGDLAGLGRSVVLSDGSGGLHVLDAATGRLRGSTKVLNEVMSLRAIDEGTPQVVVIEDVPSHAWVPWTLDLEKVALVPSTLDTSQVNFWCVGDGTRACALYPKDEQVEALKPFAGPIHYATHQLLPEDRAKPNAGLYRYPTGDKEWREHALVWNGPRPAWHGALAGTSQPWVANDNDEHEHKGTTAVDHESVYYVYPAVKGDYRLTRRDLATGKLRYDVPVDGVEGDEAVDSLAVDGDQLVLLNHTNLYVIDATTGAVRKFIDTI